MKEIWKTIKIYTNFEVSNFGRIRNKNKEILKGFTNSAGYRQICLGYKRNSDGTFIMKDGKKVIYNAMINRLVAEAFIPYTGLNPDGTPIIGAPQVNHKSEKKSDNSVDNLEWCSAIYNSNYGTRTIRQRNYSNNMSDTHRKKLSIAAKNRGNDEHIAQKVGVKLTLGNEEICFDSVRAAATFLKCNISKVHYAAKHNTTISSYSVQKLN